MSDKDFYVEARISADVGAETAGMGMIFSDRRKTGKKRDCKFIIAAEGQLKIFNDKEELDQSDLYQDWRFDKNIKTGLKSENILAVQKKGKQYLFFVNGVKVFEKGNIDFWGNYIGIFCSNNVEISVDHFIIKQDRGPINTMPNPKEALKENLGANVNSEYSEGTPVISPDGLNIYFRVEGSPESMSGVEDSWRRDHLP